MSSLRRCLLFLVLCSSTSLSASGNPPSQQVITIEKGEKWWAGVIADSHLMPFENSIYEFDFYGNTAGNQGQPLLISTRGRYVWCEKPFKFKFEDGVLHLSSRFGALETGRYGNSLAEVYRAVSRRYFPPSGRIPAPELFTLPQFNTWIEFTYDQNQAGIIDYAQKIVKIGFPPGVLMIDEGWFQSYGELEFDRGRFPDPHAMMEQLRGLGFKVMLWVCPYIRPDGPFWKTLWLNHIKGRETVWILNAEDDRFPVLMQWWDGFSNVVDLSNPGGLGWFKKQLDRLIRTYGVSGFKFDGGDAAHYSESRLQSPARSYRDAMTPNLHSELFVRLGLDYPFNEYRAAWKMGGQPIAMRLRDKRHDWEDLAKLVPGSINQGLMGYPFTCPDLIGGGEYLSFIDLQAVDQELIVRAAQCHALMPMMQFSVAPWRVLSAENLAICLEMARLHARMGEEILQLARDAARTGEPMVRSLEYQYPHRGYAGICDQFLLGESILVAPVLEKGARTRIIRFPEGMWHGEDGTAVKGPAVIEVEAPLSRLPWYRKE